MSYEAHRGGLAVVTVRLEPRGDVPLRKVPLAEDFIAVDADPGVTDLCKDQIRGRRDS